jgi:hypothetical protein
MKQEEAIRIALDMRSTWDVDSGFADAAAEKCIVEIVQGQPVDKMPGAGPTVDHVAWVVTLSKDFSTVEFAIDDATGLLLRIRKSRSAVLDAERRKGNAS